MNIALVCDRYPPRPHSGIGAFVQMLARGLRQRGHTVIVAEIGEHYQERIDQGVSVFMLSRSRLRWMGNLITRLRLQAWLAARVRRGELDLVEVPDYPGFLPFGVPGCATVVRLHQSATVSHRLAGLKTSPGMYFYEKQTLAANRDWIAVSTHILSLTEGAFGISPRKFAVIHNGIVAAKEEMGTVPNLPAHFVLYAGQVSRRKGSLVLAEAAREFLPRHPDIHLVYAGGCLPEAGVPPIDDTITQIVGTDLAARVHFLGQLTREQVLSCMHRAAVFAFPALIDCFPLVVLEAMTAGVPVVFTRNPPGPEMIEDGVSGLLADPTAPLDFSEKIGRLLDDKKLAARLGAQGQARVASRFSLEQCVQATEQFYGECLRDARSRLQITDSPTAWNQPQPNTSLSPRLETKKPA